MKMAEFTFSEIGRKLAEAFRLQTAPLAVYGSENIPPNAVHLSESNPCFAVTMYRMATTREVSAIYVGKDDREGCCPGGIAYTGFVQRPDYVKYFVSTGKSDVRGGAAEYLKATPDLVDRSFAEIGKITPPGKFLIVQSCEVVPVEDPGVLSICCFGTAEQIRNMAALIHFDRFEPFSPVIVPWGPSCATFITYPAGLAEKAPIDTAFMGPQDPTQNASLPPDTMALGIPAEMAVRMVNNLERSFVLRRPTVAFPDHAPKDPCR